MLGDVAFEMHDYAIAEENYHRSLELREVVEREVGTDWANRDISIIWKKVAGMYARAGRIRDASDAYEKAVYTANDLFEETGLPIMKQSSRRSARRQESSI
jgi:tetratricopeptide (TPR) repeat protein